MANYKRITDIEVMEEVSENSMALVEDNGTLKKVPCGKGFGGGGVATAIIKDVMHYDNAIAGVSAAMSSEPAHDYQCINMTFNEAWELLMSGQPLQCIVMDVYDGVPGMMLSHGTEIQVEISAITFYFGDGSVMYRWKLEDGFYEYSPSE